MSEIRVALAGGAEGFRPGEEVSGTVSWNLEIPPSRLEVRLFWHTEGKGDSDVQIACMETFPDPGREGSRSFRMRIPDAPWSFSGKLISLKWAVEAVAEPAGVAGSAPMVVSPTGREIVIGKPAE
ncbi:MAG TPA: hypothetical protein VIA29_01850 [Thermoanaerobaculia bacterium]